MEALSGDGGVVTSDINDHQRRSVSTELDNALFACDVSHMLWIVPSLIGQRPHASPIMNAGMSDHRE